MIFRGHPRDWRIRDEATTGREVAREKKRRRPVRELLEERVAPAVGGLAVPPTGPTPPAEVAGASGSSLPLGLQYAASEALGAVDPAYAMAADGAGFALSNATNAYGGRVDAGGFAVGAGADSWSLTVSGVGYGGATAALGSGVATATANRVEYDYGAISQWFVNGPLGLQQGFTLARRPDGAATGGPLAIDLAAGGNLTATADPSGTSVTLARADGSSSLVYGGLIAYDAAGSAIPARMVADGDKISILVDDAKAVYPLTVDPFVQQAKVVGLTTKAGQAFGSAVALSPSGTIAAISAVGPMTGPAAGSVFIFTTDGTSWTRRAELTADDGVVGDDFGVSLAFSADTSTLVVGARNKTVAGRAGRGAAYVFRQGATPAAWTQVARLTATDGLAGDFFGQSTAVNAKGTIIVVGAPLADIGGKADQGAAYVFTASSATTWNQATRLTAYDGAAGALYGYSVAVNSAGTVVAVGAPEASGPGGAEGAVYTYFQGIATKLSVAGAKAGDGLGNSVALDDDGSFLLVGAPTADIAGRVDQGAVYVFARSWDAWNLTATLTASDPAAGARFGSAVAISPDGLTAAIGSPSATFGSMMSAGAVYAFERTPGASWTETNRLVANDAAAFSQFGAGVAISSGVVLAGSPFDPPIPASPSQGAAYFFRNPSTLAVVSGPSNRTVPAGVPTTLTAASSPYPGRTVQWQVNTGGSTWSDIAGATNPWYSFTPTTADSGKRFRAVFSAPGESPATTAAATLTVVKAPVELTITSNANPRRVGDPLTITVAAAGVGALSGLPVAGPVTLTLQRAGTSDKPVVLGPMNLVNGRVSFSVPSSPDIVIGTYTVSASHPGDATLAASTATTSQVVVRGTTTLTATVPETAAVGSRVTLVMTLTPRGGLGDISGGIVIKDGGKPIGYPQAKTVDGVTTATFETPPLTAGNHYYQFMFLGNREVDASSTGVYIMTVGGAASAAATPPAPASASATGGEGPRTNATITPPANFSVDAGTPFTLTAAATGVVPSHVQWQYRDRTGGADQYWINIIDANSPWLTLTPTASMQGRQYRAVFTDLAGNYDASSPVTLNVASGMTVNVTSNAVPRRVGDPLTITAVASAAAPGVGPITGGTMTVTIRREGSAGVLMSFSGTPINGMAAFAIPTTLPVGSYTATATYDNPTFGVASASTSQVVVRGTTTLTAAVPETAAVGSRVRLVMTLTARGGLDDMSGGIVIKDGGQPIGYPQVETVDGVTTAIFDTPPLTAGIHYYQFMFLGNRQIQASSTGVYVMTVGGASASAIASAAGPRTMNLAPPASATAAATLPAVDGVALAGAFADNTASKPRGSSAALSFWRSAMR